ncbi:MAG: hypothetical protein HFI34_07460 [Lachnospiraceae bacterium]|nr:hypothetical protein [Lachnospiraceae bacterium]
MRRNKISPKDNSIKKIMILGTELGVGVTHFSILLASYYVFILGKKVCIADLSETNDYRYMEQIYHGDNLFDTSDYIYPIKKIDFLIPAGKPDRRKLIQTALTHSHDIIIFDNGTKSDDIQQDMIMCDRKYIIGNCSLWKVLDFEKQISRLTNIYAYQYLYTFGQIENTEAIRRKYGIKFWQIPYTDSPFRIEKKQLSEIEKIIWEE